MSDKLSGRSPATQVSVQKTEELGQTSYAFLLKYYQLNHDGDKYTYTPKALTGQAEEDEKYKENPLLEHYFHLRQIEDKLADLPYQPGALEAVHHEMGLIQEKLKDPQVLNEAFLHLTYLLRSGLCAPMANLIHLRERTAKNNYQYGESTGKKEAGYFNSIDEKKIAFAEEYLDLLYNVTAEVDPKTKSVSENKTVSALYHDSKRIIQSYRDLTDGRLYVPDKALEEEDGVKIHRISNVVVQEDGTKSFIEPEYTDAFSRQKLQERDNMVHELEPSLTCKSTVYYKENKGPLFFHEPCPEDVIQGSLGDCYLVSAMQAISSQCPDFIKDSMIQNKDGSVTVRFYNEKNEPVFVTVSDTLPCMKQTLTDSQGKVVRESEKQIYASQSHWVGILEKAFVESGLSKNDLDGPGRQAGVPSQYGQIKGGEGYAFVKRFMGPHLDRFDVHHYEIGGDNATQSQSIGLAFYDNYIQEELELFNKIQKDIDENRFIVCGKVPSPSENEGEGNAYQISKGLPGKHAYSVLNCVEDEYGLRYIKVLDPNRTIVRTYDRGRAKIDDNPEYAGESLVELHEFYAKFHSVHSVDPTNSISNQKRFKEADEYKRVYGEPIEALCKEILEQDDFLHHLGNSTQYNKLLVSAGAALKELNSERPNKENIQNRLTDLFDKAEKYLQYRNTSPKSAKNEHKPVSAARYSAAEALVNIKGIYEFNQNQPIQNCETIEAHEILEDTLHSPLNRENNAQVAGRQYRYLKEMKTNAIQAIRTDNSKHSVKGSIDSKFKLNKGHLVDLIYANVLQKSFNKISLQDMNDKLNPDLPNPEKATIAENLDRVMNFMSMEKVEKIVFGPNAESKLYAHYLEGLKTFNKQKKAEKTSPSVSQEVPVLS